jgi:hypothetical protein
MVDAAELINNVCGCLWYCSYECSMAFLCVLDLICCRLIIPMPPDRNVVCNSIVHSVYLWICLVVSRWVRLRIHATNDVHAE